MAAYVSFRFVCFAFCSELMLACKEDQISVGPLYPMNTSHSRAMQCHTRLVCTPDASIIYKPYWR